MQHPMQVKPADSETKAGKINGSIKNGFVIEHSEKKLLNVLKTNLDSECSIPAFNKHWLCKNFTQ